MEELRAESERLLESIEGAMARVMADKKRTDTALAKATAALEEAEDMNYDLEQRVGKLERVGKVQSLSMLRQMLVYINEINAAKQEGEARRRQEVGELEARLRREVALQARQAQLARDRLHELETMRESMQVRLCCLVWAGATAR